MLWILLVLGVVILIAGSFIIFVMRIISPVLHFRKEVNAYNRRVQPQNNHSVVNYNAPAIAEG